MLRIAPKLAVGKEVQYLIAFTWPLHFLMIKKKVIGAGEIVLWVGHLTCKVAKLGSLPGTQYALSPARSEP